MSQSAAFAGARLSRPSAPLLSPALTNRPVASIDPFQTIRQQAKTLQNRLFEQQKQIELQKTELARQKKINSSINDRRGVLLTNVAQIKAETAQLDDVQLDVERLTKQITEVLGQLAAECTLNNRRHDCARRDQVQAARIVNDHEVNLQGLQVQLSDEKSQLVELQDRYRSLCKHEKDVSEMILFSENQMQRHQEHFAEFSLRIGTAHRDLDQWNQERSKTEFLQSAVQSHLDQIKMANLMIEQQCKAFLSQSLRVKQDVNIIFHEHTALLEKYGTSMELASECRLISNSIEQFEYLLKNGNLLITSLEDDCSLFQQRLRQLTDQHSQIAERYSCLNEEYLLMSRNLSALDDTCSQLEGVNKSKARALEVARSLMDQKMIQLSVNDAENEKIVSENCEQLLASKESIMMETQLRQQALAKSSTTLRQITEEATTYEIETFPFIKALETDQNKLLHAIKSRICAIEKEGDDDVESLHVSLEEELSSNLKQQKASEKKLQELNEKSESVKNKRCEVSELAAKNKELEREIFEIEKKIEVSLVDDRSNQATICSLTEQLNDIIIANKREVFLSESTLQGEMKTLQTKVLTERFDSELQRLREIHTIRIEEKKRQICTMKFEMKEMKIIIDSRISNDPITAGDQKVVSKKNVCTKIEHEKNCMPVALEVTSKPSRESTPALTKPPPLRNRHKISVSDDELLFELSGGPAARQFPLNSQMNSPKKTQAKISGPSHRARKRTQHDQTKNLTHAAAKRFPDKASNQPIIGSDTPATTVIPATKLASSKRPSKTSAVIERKVAPKDFKGMRNETPKGDKTMPSSGDHGINSSRRRRRRLNGPVTDPSAPQHRVQHDPFSLTFD